MNTFEFAIMKAKDRIAREGMAAYALREKEERDGIQHEPGTVIAGFPDWIKIYQEELAAIGIESTQLSDLFVYQTQPFEDLSKLRGKT
jgi:hypothetical protein